ncbi:hypothetical protein RMATCC62417_08344 [Rhizopus microsporus]|nr:hypothetical protein RMATCC62417_08344 [Rhizopus microsporus]
MDSTTSDYLQPTTYSLIVRQQPSKARLCSFKEKVDRRPIDPPPIIELLSNTADDHFLQNPYFFLYATLTDASGKNDLHFVNGNKTTAGAVVQSLYKLKDLDNSDGGFFIFSDISVRLEGLYRLKFTLFSIEGPSVNRLCSTLSDVFQVYSPKSFPGMSESTFLTRCFSDQGVRIRIRKEPRSAHLGNSSKRRRRNTNESDDDDNTSLNDTYIEQYQKNPPAHSSASTPYFDKAASPIDFIEPNSNNRHDYIVKPTLPSPKELFKSSAMSMQNILSNDRDQLYHIVDTDNTKENRLLCTRKLPLPLPSHAPQPSIQQEKIHLCHPLQQQQTILLNTNVSSSRDQSPSYTKG